LEYRAVFALLLAVGVWAGLLAGADITGIEPAGQVPGLALAMTVCVLAAENLPTVAFLAALPQFNDDGFQLVDHVTTFLDKLQDDFDLVVGNIVAHEYLWQSSLNSNRPRYLSLPG
jgi:hypothetical protein